MLKGLGFSQNMQQNAMSFPQKYQRPTNIPQQPQQPQPNPMALQKASPNARFNRPVQPSPRNWQGMGQRLQQPQGIPTQPQMPQPAMQRFQGQGFPGFQGLPPQMKMYGQPSMGNLGFDRALQSQDISQPGMRFAQPESMGIPQNPDMTRFQQIMRQRGMF